RSLSFLTIRHHPSSTLFPYTTLFRSLQLLIELVGCLRLGGILDAYGNDDHVVRCNADGPDDAVSIVVFLNHGSNRPAYANTVAADRKSTRLNSSHVKISYAVFCLKKK